MTPPPILPSQPGEPIGSPGLSAPSPRKFNWVLFLAVLLVPPVLTALAAGHGKDAAPAIAFIGAGLSAIVASVLLALHFGKTDAGRIGLGIVFFAVFGVACITMNCIGCFAGGFNLKF